MIPTPCLGVIRTPWAYALGRDLVGERKPRLRCMGYPAAKRQYIIESLSQRCLYQLLQRGRQMLIAKAVQINKGQNRYLAKRMFPGTCFKTQVPS